MDNVRRRGTGTEAELTGGWLFFATSDFIYPALDDPSWVGQFLYPGFYLSEGR